MFEEGGIVLALHKSESCRFAHAPLMLSLMNFMIQWSQAIELQASALEPIYVGMFVVATKNWIPNIQRNTITKKKATLLRKIYDEI